MRRWCAALVFVPALAWGDLCFSVEEREAFAQLAQGMQSALQRGGSESDLLAVAQGTQDPALRAALYEAISHLVMAHPMSISGVVSAMQLACYDAIQR